MELKHEMDGGLQWINYLLIVPYGIETPFTLVVG